MEKSLGTKTFVLANKKKLEYAKPYTLLHTRYIIIYRNKICILPTHGRHSIFKKIKIFSKLSKNLNKKKIVKIILCWFFCKPLTRLYPIQPYNKVRIERCSQTAVKFIKIIFKIY